MPAAIEDVASALSRRAGEVLANAHSDSRRGNLNLSLINSLCVRGCVQFLAWVATAPLGSDTDPPAGPEAVGAVADMRVLNDLLLQAGEVCQHSMLGHAGASSVEILVHARPGGWVSRGADGRQLAVASPQQAAATAAAAEALGAGATSRVSSGGISAAPLLVEPACLTWGKRVSLNIVVPAWQTPTSSRGANARVLLIQGHLVVLDCIAAPVTGNLSEEQQQVAQGMPAGSLLYR
jgi:hypothetical protein